MSRIGTFLGWLVGIMLIFGAMWAVGQFLGFICMWLTVTTYRVLSLPFSLAWVSFVFYFYMALILATVFASVAIFIEKED